MHFELIVTFFIFPEKLRRYLHVKVHENNRFLRPLYGALSEESSQI